MMEALTWFKDGDLPAAVSGADDAAVAVNRTV